MNNTIISQKWQLVKQDIKKVGKGLLIALAGSACAFLGDASGLIDYQQYGTMGPVIALAISSVCSTLVNMISKWISFNTYSKPELTGNKQ